MGQLNKVLGHNNATYGPGPREDQVFSVGFLENSPTPIIADRLFFVHLRGYLPESKTKKLGMLGDSLAAASFAVSSSVMVPDGSRDESKARTGPLRTMRFSDDARLVIRDALGAQVEHVSSSGRSDILLDFSFLLCS